MCDVWYMSVQYIGCMCVESVWGTVVCVVCICICLCVQALLLNVTAISTLTFKSGSQALPVTLAPRVQAFPSLWRDQFLFLFYPRSAVSPTVQASRKCAIFIGTTNASNSIFLLNLQAIYRFSLF